MKKTLLIGLGILACTASLVWAQDHTAKKDPAAMAQHHIEMLATVLDLNATQKQQALTIFTNVVSAHSGMHEQMHAAHQSLAAAIKNNDSAGIDQAAAAIGNMFAQGISGEAKAFAAFRQILTPAQITKLDQLESEGGGEMFHGMGMMHEMMEGPPPPPPGSH